MKKRILLISVCLLVLISGCTTLGTTGKDIEELNLSNRKNLLKLRVGMTKEELVKMMGGDIVSKVFDRDRYYVTNPLLTETPPTSSEGVWEVYYYCVSCGCIGFDDKTRTIPIIMCDGIIEGWGWGWFEKKPTEQKIDLDIK